MRKADAVKKSLVRGAAAVGGAAALFVVFGSGPAGANNEYAGMTYGDAVNAIQGAGATAVIATKVGDTSKVGSVWQCTVTGSRNISFLDSSGNNSGGKVMLDLNCNYPFALPGVAGASHASPEGKAAYDQAVQQAQEQQQKAQEAQQQAQGSIEGG